MASNICQPLEELYILQSNINKLYKRNTLLAAKLKAQNEELISLKQQEDLLRQEVTTYRDMVSSNYSAVTEKCRLHDKNRQLEEHIQSLDQKISQQQMSHNNEIQEMRKKMELEQVSYETRLHQVKESVEATAQCELDHMKTVLQEKNGLIDNLQSELSRLKQDKDSKLQRLRLECDSKLMKLQQQQQQQQIVQAAQPSSASHDIFRKKLQHVRDEADRDRTRLQQRIHELEQQLATDQEFRHPCTPGRKTPLKQQRW